MIFTDNTTKINSMVMGGFSSKKRTFKVTGRIFHVNIIALVANHEMSTNGKMLPGSSVIVNK